MFSFRMPSRIEGSFRSRHFGVWIFINKSFHIRSARLWKSTRRAHPQTEWNKLCSTKRYHISLIYPLILFHSEMKINFSVIFYNENEIKLFFFRTTQSHFNFSQFMNVAEAFFMRYATYIHICHCFNDSKAYFIILQLTHIFHPSKSPSRC